MSDAVSSSQDADSSEIQDAGGSKIQDADGSKMQDADGSDDQSQTTEDIDATADEWIKVYELTSWPAIYYWSYWRIMNASWQYIDWSNCGPDV